MNKDNLGDRSFNSDEERIRFKAWQVKKLNSIKDHLNSEWLGKYERLMSEVGEQKVRPAISFGPVEAFYRPDISPINKEQLGSMAPKDAFQYIASWKPSLTNRGESDEGLAQVWAEVIEDKVIEYLKLAADFLKEVYSPIFKYYFLKGISSGLNKLDDLHSFEWGELIRLGKMIGDHIQSNKDNTVDPEDNYQSGIKRELLDIIETGIKGPKFALPFENKQAIWETIEAFTQDPEPDLEYERAYGPPNMESVVMSINTVRGKAFHCVIRYALWNDFHQNMGKTDNLRAHSLPPEVKYALSMILESEKTQTVWSVLGFYLNSFIYLDAAWLNDNFAKVIPFGSDSKTYTDAFFGGYFSFSEPYGQLYRIFKKILESALDWMLEEPEVRTFYHPRERAAQHLIVYYWWGLENFNNPNSLINQFFTKATVGMRARAINFIGRSLENFTPDLPNVLGVYEKLEQLYDWRLGVAEDSGKAYEYVIELREFGWWVANAHSGGKWLMSRLLKTLEITDGELEWGEAVLDKLPEYAREYCELVAEILNKIIEGDRSGYNLRYWVPKFRRIIVAIEACGSEKANVITGKAINKLAAKEGITDLKDLL